MSEFDSTMHFDFGKDLENPVRGIIRVVCDAMEEKGRRALRIEGRNGNSWLLVDFGDVIVNVFDRASREFYNFDKPSREFYNFDHHLPEGSKVDIAPLVAEVDSKFDINKN